MFHCYWWGFMLFFLQLWCLQKKILFHLQKCKKKFFVCLWKTEIWHSERWRRPCRARNLRPWRFTRSSSSPTHRRPSTLRLFFRFPPPRIKIMIPFSNFPFLHAAQSITCWWQPSVSASSRVHQSHASYYTARLTGCFCEKWQKMKPKPFFVKISF
jgi:hypothetical protein